MEIKGVILSGAKRERKWIRKNIPRNLIRKLCCLELSLMFNSAETFATVTNVSRTWFSRDASHCPHAGLKTGEGRRRGGDGAAPLGLRTEVPAGVLSALSPEGTGLPLSLPCSLRSGSDVRDYSLTGYVWSAVTPERSTLGTR